MRWNRGVPLFQPGNFPQYPESVIHLIEFQIERDTNQWNLV